MRPGGVTQADIHGHDGDMWPEKEPQDIIHRLDYIIDEYTGNPGTIQLPGYKYELFKIWWLKNASSNYKIGEDMHYRSWHITKENM